jgi:hypothetical protein
MIERDERMCCDTDCRRGFQGWVLGSIVPSTSHIEYTCHSVVLIYLGPLLSTITPLYPAINQYIHTADVNDRRHVSMAVFILEAVKT